MTATCHRCGGDLAADTDSHFCPHCGAPQLMLSSAVRDGGDEADAPPRSARAQEIAWRPALRAAMLITAGAVLLFAASVVAPVLSLAFLLWAGSASLLTLELYRRSNRAAVMNAAIGARIGASVGVLLTAGLAAAVAGAGLIARFGLDRMGRFDAEMQERMAEQIRAATSANPAAAALAAPQRMPELIAGSVVLGLGLLGALVFAVSVAGGAIGGRLRERRERDSR